MQYEYGGWTIDATPDFSLGKFFARATLTRASPDPEAGTKMHEGRDLAWFDSESEAIEFARQWAITWIDDQSARQWAVAWVDNRGISSAGTYTEPPTSGNGLRVEALTK
ncbi:hypothetical protein [Paraburkholderia lacunae]|uniref:hypothetical protein n=1 Tax=Paraburkholderia lacunae TaxID=2211104 RepID=UPI001AD811E2|nr:hypothetical protein [Paraburkholderia lacunae]